MNEKDSKAIHELFSEFHCSDNLGLLKSKLVNCVAAVRQEERRAAFKEAARIAGDFRRLDRDTLWSIYKTLSAETALIEAATNETKTEEDRDDGLPER